MLPGRPRVELAPRWRVTYSQVESSPWKAAGSRSGPGMYATVLRDERPFMGLAADPRDDMAEMRGGRDEQGEWDIYESRRQKRNRTRRQASGTNVVRFGGGCAGAHASGGGVGGGCFRVRGDGGETHAGDDRSERRVRMAMWKCGGCGKNSFVERFACFSCGRGRTAAAALVEEFWREIMLPMDIAQRFRSAQTAGGASRAGREGIVFVDGHNSYRRMDERGRGVAGREGGEEDGRRLDHLHLGKGGGVQGEGNFERGKGWGGQAAEHRSIGPLQREVGHAYAKAKGKVGDGGTVDAPAAAQSGSAHGFGAAHDGEWGRDTGWRS